MTARPLPRGRADVPPQAASLGTFASLIVAHALVDSCSNVWPVFKKFAGLDLYWAGVLATAATFTAMAAQPLFGLWADRGRRRSLLLAGVALACLSMLLGPLGSRRELLGGRAGYGVMFAVLMLSWLGLAMFHPAGASLAGAVSSRRRSTFVALFIAAGMVGFASSQLLFSAVYLRTGGRTDYLLFPMALVWLGIAMSCRPAETAPGDRIGLRAAWRALAPAGGALAVLYLMMAMVAALHAGLFFLLPEFLEERGYPGWLVNGGAALLIILGSALAMVPAGHLADRFGRRRLLLLVLAAALVAYYALVLAPPLAVGLFGVMCVLAGGALGPANPLGVALGQHLAGAHTSLVSGVLMGWAWALGSLAPWLVGYLAQRPRVGITGALLALGAAIVVALGLAALLATGGRAGEE